MLRGDCNILAEIKKNIEETKKLAVMELMKNSELLIFQIIWLEFSVIYITILGMIKSFLKESK